MPPAKDAGSALAGNLAAIASVALWTSAFPITEILLRDWHPMLLAPARVGLGAVTLFGMMLVSGRIAELRTAPYPQVALVGTVMMGGSVMLLVWGQTMTSVVSAGIVAAMLPVIAAVLGARAGERLTAPVLVGIALATAGGAVASWTPEAAGLDPDLGDLLILISTTLWAWGSRAVVVRLPMLSDIGRAFLTMGAGAAALIVAASIGLAAGWFEPRASLAGPSLGLLLWLGVLAVGTAFLLWLSAVRRLGPTVASIHQNLVPLYVMLMALTLGERPRSPEVVGAVLVVLGAVAAQMGRRSATRRSN